MTVAEKKVFNLSDLVALDPKFDERLTEVTLEVETAAGPLLLHFQPLSTYDRLQYQSVDSRSIAYTMGLFRRTLIGITPPADERGKQERKSPPTTPEFFINGMVAMVDKDFVSGLGERIVMEAGAKINEAARWSEEERTQLRFIGRSVEPSSDAAESDTGADASNAAEDSTSEVNVSN